MADLDISQLINGAGYNALWKLPSDPITYSDGSYFYRSATQGLAAAQAQVAAGRVLAQDTAGNYLVRTNTDVTTRAISVATLQVSQPAPAPPPPPPPPPTIISTGPPAPPPPTPTPTPTPTPIPTPIPTLGAPPQLIILPPPALPPIPPAASFSTLVALTLGNAGTPADGFDVIFQVPAQAFATDFQAASDLGIDIAAADFVEGVLDAASIQPLLDEIASFLDVGDGLIFTGNTNSAAAVAQISPVVAQATNAANQINSGQPPA